MDSQFFDADSVGTDQTGHLPGLLRVSAVRTGHCVAFIMVWLQYRTSSFSIYLSYRYILLTEDANIYSITRSENLGVKHNCI